MTLHEALKQYQDSLGYYSSKINPKTGDEGNPLTESGTAAILFHELNEVSNKDREWFTEIVGNLQYLEPGCYDKKFDAGGSFSEDKLSHDDLIGVVAGAVAMNTKHAYDVCIYGWHHGWIIGNQNKFYYTSLVKPWHKAFYKICAGSRPSFVEYISLCTSLIISAYIGPDDASGKRLEYLMIKAIEILPSDKGSFLKKAINIWKSRIVAKNIFARYHGDVHPFTLFCKE